MPGEYYAHILGLELVFDGRPEEGDRYTHDGIVYRVTEEPSGREVQLEVEPRHMRSSSTPRELRVVAVAE